MEASDIRLVEMMIAEALRIHEYSHEGLRSEVTALADGLAAALAPIVEEEEAAKATEAVEEIVTEAIEAEEEVAEEIAEIAEETVEEVTELTAAEALDEIEPLRTHPLLRPIRLRR